LVASRKITGSDEGTIRLNRHFGPCDGHLLMVTDRAIDQVRITVPERAKPGDTVGIEISVVDADGRPLDAVVPVRVDLRDPHGRAAESTGFYGAKDGQLQIRADLAANDTPGLWRITARELASGIEHSAYVRVGP
jgi:hypothetical protein